MKKQMKTKTRTAACVFCTFLFAAAPFKSHAAAETGGAAKKSVLRNIAESGTFTVAVTKTDNPPFCFTDKNGMTAGFDIRLAKRIADELHAELIVNREAQTFDDVIQFVAAGKADAGISKLSKNLDRAARVRFTRPYLVLRQGLLYNRVRLAKRIPEKKIRQFTRAFDEELGVLGGTVYSTYAKKHFPNAKTVLFASWEDAVAALRAGDILALYRDDLAIQQVMNSEKDSFLLYKPLYFTDKTDQIAIAVHEDDTLFLDYLNFFLELYQPPATAAQILDMYQ
ncbi:MAG: ABC transporter substrate-binding protein [Bacteroides sp.]|nr:ABC transporter substrate-binding protein [Prevotella sp.]MCM1406914.1 ABC transporter substrate-binding protein [Treponema brennaborense]MCM1470065.1 ABC transporter substrate-binding protein [Bacteroides sp.]